MTQIGVNLKSPFQPLILWSEHSQCLTLLVTRDGFTLLPARISLPLYDSELISVLLMLFVILGLHRCLPTYMCALAALVVYLKDLYSVYCAVCTIIKLKLVKCTYELTLLSSCDISSDSQKFCIVRVLTSKVYKANKRFLVDERVLSHFH